MSGLGEQARGVLRDVVAALSAADLAELGSPARVFTDPPRGAAYPYVTLGAVRSEDRADSGGARAAHEFSLHLWNRGSFEGGGGGAALLSLLARVQAVLERDLPHAVVPLFADIFPDRRGGAAPFSRHGLLRLRVITE